MRRKIFHYIFLSIIFIIIFYLIDTLTFEAYNIAPYLTIVFIVLIYIPLNNFVHKWIDVRIKSLNTHVENEIDDFLHRLNEIVDYKELLDELKQLYHHIFPGQFWVLYIFEQKYYLLRESGSDLNKIKLPHELNIPQEKIKREIIDLRKSELAPELKDAGLNILIPLQGKNQVYALFFTTEKNYNFLLKSASNSLLKEAWTRCGHLLESTALYLDVLSRNLEIKKLFEVSEKLLSTLDTKQILQFILDALSEIFHYDAAVIFLLDSATGKLENQAFKGYDKKINDISLKVDQGACGWVARNKKPSLYEDVSVAEYYYPLRKETRSQVALPLMIQDEVSGVICLESNTEGQFTNDSLEMLTIFANQAAIALHHAKQHEILKTKKSLEHELINAAKVQQVLLPKRNPGTTDLAISFINIPSKIVGGDVFDFFSSEKHLGIAIGDVSGKGAAAAIMVSLVLAGFRTLNKTYFTACEIMAKLNNLLYESVSSVRYASFFYGIISLTSKSFVYTNAGHNPPLLFKKDGSTQRLTGGGIVLGFLENETYTQKEVEFEKDDIIVLYTDGISEAMDEHDNEFGEERIIEVVQKNKSKTPNEIREELIAKAKKFSGERIHDDDISIIIIKHK